jgi:hypothetical protein
MDCSGFSQLVRAALNAKKKIAADKYGRFKNISMFDKASVE